MGTQDSNTLLKILDEKDKLIVSLKESATKRDKLNEHQIQVLSRANHDLQTSLQSATDKLNTMQEKLYQAESELTAYKTANQSISEKLESIQNEFTLYKNSITEHLNSLKTTVAEEWTKREENYQASFTQLKKIIDDLEKKAQGIEEHYQTILQNIADKQSSAKVFIREAIDKLNDALNLLDLGDTNFFSPRSRHDDLKKASSNAKTAVQNQSESLAAQSSGETIIKNIENVNIELTADSRLNSLFSEVQNLSTAAQEPASSGSSSGGTGHGTDSASAESIKNNKEKNSSADNVSSSGNHHNSPENKSSGLSPESSHKTDTDNNETQRTILDRDNFAPFDWERILSDMQLKKFENFIRSANNAIKNGKYMKAIDLFKTIRDQPSIQDSNVAVKMIDDEIEYLEKHIKNKYSQTDS